MSEAPPSTSRICPVIQLASAEQSSATAFPRSAGMPCEVTAQDLQRRLGRTHGHPRLPTAEAAAGRIGHGDDPSSSRSIGTASCTPTRKALACDLMAKSNISSRMVIGPS